VCVCVRKKEMVDFETFREEVITDEGL